jgi:3-oxoacyl-[acyl-carrier-protein] synthase III
MVQTDCRREGAAQPTIGIQAVAFHVGEVRPIEELPRLKDDAAALAQFKARGFGHYTRSGLDIAAQAVASGQATLRLAGKSPGDIDAIVLGVVELRWYTGVQEDLAGAVARGLGFANIHVVGVCLGGCTNLTSLMRVAKSLIVSEGYRNVLVIESNKCLEDGSDRLVPPDISIFSDGAVSFVVTRDDWCR